MIGQRCFWPCAPLHAHSAPPNRKVVTPLVGRFCKDNACPAKQTIITKPLLCTPLKVRTGCFKTPLRVPFKVHNYFFQLQTPATVHTPAGGRARRRRLARPCACGQRHVSGQRRGQLATAGARGPPPHVQHNIPSRGFCRGCHQHVPHPPSALSTLPPSTPPPASPVSHPVPVVLGQLWVCSRAPQASAGMHMHMPSSTWFLPQHAWCACTCPFLLLLIW